MMNILLTFIQCVYGHAVPVGMDAVVNLNRAILLLLLLLLLLLVGFFHMKTHQIEFLFFNFVETSKATTHTIYQSHCRYHDSRYGIIGLAAVGSVTGKAIFKDVKSIYPSNYVWSYNPCYVFSEGDCHNVAGCQSKSCYSRL